MTRRLFVGNLSFTVTDQQLAQKFGEAGTVTRAYIVLDRETRKSRGFGFVEMASEADAAAAIRVLDGTEVFGRALRVSEAKESGSRDRAPHSGRERQKDHRGGREARW